MSTKKKVIKKAVTKKKYPAKNSFIEQAAKGVSIEATNQIPGEKILHRDFTVDEVLNMVHTQLITKAEGREFLNIPETIVSEKHAVSIKPIGLHGSIGLLHLYPDGTALFIPKERKPTKKFEDTGLTFNIEPVSFEVEKEEKPANQPEGVVDESEEESVQESDM